MGFAGRCACGNLAESFGGLCDRCVALKALELFPGANSEQIDNAFRTLVKVWHPDRFENDPNLQLAAEEKLKEINAAHEFLLSEEATRSQPVSRPKPPEPVAEPQHVQAPVAVAAEFTAQAEPEMPEAPVLPRRESPKPWSRLLFRAGVAAAVTAALTILWVIADGALSASSVTGPAWQQTKNEMALNFQATRLHLWYSATTSAQQEKAARDAAIPPESQRAPQQAASQQSQPSVQQGQNPQPLSAQDPTQVVVVNWVPPASAASEPPPAPVVVPARRRIAVARHISVSRVSSPVTTVQPYVTAGLTPLEVLTILGKPTSSVGEKMFYRDSEIDFRNGRVAGWVIDPKMSPIRVKLWPDKVPVPGVTRFAFGSSKSDVIALQGTPTLFSQNKFGYGDSIVYFRNDRVIGWNDDPNSVRLRVAH